MTGFGTESTIHTSSSWLWKLIRTLVSGFFTREKMTSRVTYHEFDFGNGNNKFCVKRKSNWYSESNVLNTYQVNWQLVCIEYIIHILISPGPSKFFGFYVIEKDTLFTSLLLFNSPFTTPLWTTVARSYDEMAKAWFY